jgi:heavy metal translocating P-type ATPase
MMIKLKERWPMFIIVFLMMGMAFYAFFKSFNPIWAEKILIGLCILGSIPCLIQIIHQLYQKNFGADVLAAMALLSSLGLHQYLTAILIIFMLATGQTLERYAKNKASSVLLSLAQRMPKVAHRQSNQRTEDIPLDQVQLNDVIILYPHETCPVDGIVLEGHGSMDESYLTGEPYQISKTPGSLVLSGAMNGESRLIIQTSQITAQSRYYSIIKVLEEAEQKRTRIRRLSDQLGMIFTPIALITASMAAFISHDPIRFLAVLVIATPCPLIIAIPMTIMSAISKAASQSMIIKDPSVLEQLPLCQTAIFDKTGTLTYGKPELTDIQTCSNFNETQLLQYAASLEQYSKHPLASAILQAAQVQSISLQEVDQLTERPGEGLQGIVDQHLILVTGRKNLLKQYPTWVKDIPQEQAGLECVMVVDGQCAGTLHFHDAIRAETKPLIAHLKPFHALKKIMLVSGDREREVKHFAQEFPFTEVYASQTPEQKLSIVQKEVALAPTVFIGDGINDAHSTEYGHGRHRLW